MTSSTRRCTAPGYASQPESVSRDDGQRLTGAWITAPVRCAPPANKPTPAERDACRPVPRARAGRAADPRLRPARRLRLRRPVPRCSACGRVPRSPTASRWSCPDGRWIVGSYHVSQQNTFTGKLTEPMLDAVLRRARVRSEATKVPSPAA